jgi:eukaryotic-like serine/threonine-protein kinase
MTLPVIPERIGKFPIVRELGHGATSRVFLARDPFADRDVAIKVMHKIPETDPLTRSRFDKVFLNEASLVGKLIHPNIIAIYDADVNIEFSYIVMEYVDGFTLEPYCQVADLLPLPHVMEIAFKCGLALDFANRSGIIHRDIKPANILVGKNGAIKITDFGVALQHDVEMTQLEGVGSPMYMSPEQAQDQAITHQADISSLGVVMYRLLTGKTPFSASNSTSLLYQVINTVPPAPSVHRAGLQADVDRIVMRALAKNPIDRYQTWEEFCADLARTNRNLAPQAESIPDTEKFGAIKAVPFFWDFAHFDVCEMVRIAAFRRLPARETVVREGEACESFFPDRGGRGTGNQRRPGACSAGRRRLFRGDPVLRGQGQAHQFCGLDHTADPHRSQCDSAATLQRRLSEAVQPRGRAHSPGPRGSAVAAECAVGRSGPRKILMCGVVALENVCSIGIDEKMRDEVIHDSIGS